MFERGKPYKREALSAMLGGGVQDYLPHAGGRVTYGAFLPELNPGAPLIVLPGSGPEIERWGRVFAEQDEAIPVFLKRRSHEWIYRGNYRCVKLDEDPAAIQEQQRKTGRDDISMVLHLVRDRSAEVQPRDGDR